MSNIIYPIIQNDETEIKPLYGCMQCYFKKLTNVSKRELVKIGNERTAKMNINLVSSRMLFTRLLVTIFLNYFPCKLDTK